MDDPHSMAQSPPAPHDISSAEKPRSELALAVSSGRLSVYAALGGITGAVPLPWLPDALARRIRGALVYDIAARHGLSLSPDAREALCEPSGVEGPRSLLSHITRFLGLKLLARIGPVAFVAPARDALTTYVLGRLFDRYLSRARSGRAIRIDVDEARAVRKAIDRALIHALSTDTKRADVTAAPEELRDGITQFVDSVIGATAGVPEFLIRRIDTAFDGLIPRAQRAES